jgi:hypothetical protein
LAASSGLEKNVLRFDDMKGSPGLPAGRRSFRTFRADFLFFSSSGLLFYLFCKEKPLTFILNKYKM